MMCSILISNFNKSKYVKRCLESLISQTYKNLEIIFSDNNSSDNSLEIVSKFNHVKILKTDRKTDFPALNQIDVINKAFNYSNGEIIFLLDSDDFYKKDKVERVINFQKEKNLDFVCDIPKIYFNENNIFDFKSKIYFKFLRTWPIIYPTSSISLSRNFFLDFQKHLYQNYFSKLEIDFRLNIFASIKKKYSTMHGYDLTYYNQTNDGIMSSYSKYDKNWWIRRMQAHEYLHKIAEHGNVKNYKNLDYHVTKLINKIF